MAQYFISYSRQDTDVARRVADALADAGVEIWMDQRSIKPSDHWDRAIEAGLRESTGVVLILSPRACASNNVMDEISLAVDAKKHLIPIMIEQCQLPLRLARVQFIDGVDDLPRAIALCRSAIAGETEGEAAAGAAFPPNLLVALAELMRPLVGPVSSHLVEHEARTAPSREALLARLLERAPVGAEREALRKAFADLSV